MPSEPHRSIVRAIRKVDPDASFENNSTPLRTSSGKAYFAKMGTKREIEQYVGEAEALKAMEIAAPGIAPRLIECGIVDEETADSAADVGRPFSVSEYKDMRSLTDASAKQLAKRLATEMHTYKSTKGFGFDVPTFCGATKQDNGWYESWEKCYDALVGGLLDKLQKQGGYEELCGKGEQVRRRAIPALLGPLAVQPVLLHGDLWSGNTGTDAETGEPVIFDPSAYYGHNEADLAIARIFGGIPKSFFTTYHQHLPKTEPVDQYDLRSDLYEMYHYLNHTVLFGVCLQGPEDHPVNLTLREQGGYAGSARAKMDKLLRAFPE